MRRIAGVLVVVAVIVAGCGPSRVATPASKPWELRGSIVRFSDTALDVRHKSGRVVAVVVDSTTRFTGKGGRDARGSLWPGERVRVEVESDASGVYHARSVQVSE